MGSERPPQSTLREMDSADKLGEIPPGFVPGVRTIAAPTVKTHTDFLRAIKKGPIRDLIRTLHMQGEHVAVKWKAGEVTLFIARHRKLLFVLGTLGGIAGAGTGTWYLTRRVRRRE